ncbi:hypothetical protein ABFS83_03G127600 [Erythranthe nasuta]
MTKNLLVAITSSFGYVKKQKYIITRTKTIHLFHSKRRNKTNSQQAVMDVFLIREFCQYKNRKKEKVQQLQHNRRKKGQHLIIIFIYKKMSLPIPQSSNYNKISSSIGAQRN